MGTITSRFIACRECVKIDCLRHFIGSVWEKYFTTIESSFVRFMVQDSTIETNDDILKELLYGH